jgi:hypothetical protein
VLTWNNLQETKQPNRNLVPIYHASGKTARVGVQIKVFPLTESGQTIRKNIRENQRLINNSWRFNEFPQSGIDCSAFIRSGILSFLFITVLQQKKYSWFVARNEKDHLWIISWKIFQNTQSGWFSKRQTFLIICLIRSLNELPSFIDAGINIQADVFLISFLNSWLQIPSI